MIGDEGGIFSEALDWKFLFLLKRQINQNSICPNKEYNAIFKYIHQNIMTYCRSQKICIDQRYGKYYCILGRIQTKSGLVNKLGLSQM